MHVSAEPLYSPKKEPIRFISRLKGKTTTNVLQSGKIKVPNMNIREFSAVETEKVPEMIKSAVKLSPRNSVKRVPFYLPQDTPKPPTTSLTSNYMQNSRNIPTIKSVSSYQKMGGAGQCSSQLVVPRGGFSKKDHFRGLRGQRLNLEHQKKMFAVTSPPRHFQYISSGEIHAGRKT